MNQLHPLYKKIKQILVDYIGDNKLALWVTPIVSKITDVAEKWFESKKEKLKEVKIEEEKDEVPSFLGAIYDSESDIFFRIELDRKYDRRSFLSGLQMGILFASEFLIQKKVSDGSFKMESHLGNMYFYKNGHFLQFDMKETCGCDVTFKDAIDIPLENLQCPCGKNALIEWIEEGQKK